MNSTNIVTSVEDRATFDTFAKSIADHANSSFHGLHVLDYTYSDATFVTISDSVLVWKIGADTYYSPASVSLSSVPDREPGSLDGAYAYSEDRSAIFTDDGTDKAFPDLSGLASSLSVHAAKLVSEAHGPTTVREEDTVNALGVRVGRYVISVPYGNSSVDIYADPLRTGPPKVPLITLQPKNTKSSAGDGDSQPPVSFIVKATGDFPFTVLWQIWKSTGWYDLSRVVIQQDGSSAVTVINAGYVTSFRSSKWRARHQSLTGTKIYDNEISSTFVLLIDSSGEDTQSDAFRVRAVVSNPYGSAETNYASVKCKDSTGCWICTEVGKLVPGLFPNKHLADLREYTSTHYPKQATFYLRKCDTLVERMKSSGFDWSTLIKFEQDLIDMASRGELENAYTLYAKTVTDLCSTYWPECDSPALTKFRLHGTGKR